MQFQRLASIYGPLLLFSIVSIAGRFKMSNDSSIHCYETDILTRFKYRADQAILAACTISSVANIFVIFTAIQLFKRNNDTMHIFIINMALGDLLTLFGYSLETSNHLFTDIDIPFLSAIHFISWVGIASSSLSLTLLNVDKFIYFTLPLKYDMWMSERRAKRICFLIWVVSIGFTSNCWLNNVVYVRDGKLEANMDKNFYYQLFVVIFCIVPVTSSVLVSIYLFQLLKRRRSLRQTSASTRMNSMLFIFATTGWTAISFFPYRLVNLARIYILKWQDLDCHEKLMTSWIAYICIYLLELNPEVNPFITMFIYAPYRRLLFSFFQCKKKSPGSDLTRYSNERRPKGTKNGSLM